LPIESPRHRRRLGIGAAIAETFARAGAKVFGPTVTKKPAAETVARINGSGGHASFSRST